MEATRRASLAEEEAHQMRASELAAGASSSRTVEIAGGTTDGTVVAEETTEGVQIAEDVGSGDRTHHLADRRRFAPQVCFTYHSSIYIFIYWGKLHVFCWGWDKWNVSARVKSELHNHYPLLGFSCLCSFSQETD